MSRCMLIYCKSPSQQARSITDRVAREDANEVRNRMGPIVSNQKGDDDAERADKEKGKRRMLESFTWVSHE